MSCLELVNINEMEQKLKQQYRDASNISARINLHRDFSMNPVSWFSWVFDECSFFEGEKVLEVGCGDASLWTQNIDRIPADMQITLTDISYGMVRDATRNVGADDKRFTYEVMDAHRLYKHVLFYCDNLDAVCSEILRVLKPGGVFVCSTYSSRHMKEINDLVQQFDDRIELSAERLYEQFGKENGEAILGICGICQKEDRGRVPYHKGCRCIYCTKMIQKQDIISIYFVKNAKNIKKYLKVPLGHLL